MSSDTTYWRTQHCPHRWLYRWRIVAFDRPGVPVIEWFMTQRGAERYIRRNTWGDAR